MKLTQALKPTVYLSILFTMLVSSVGKADLDRGLSFGVPLVTQLRIKNEQLLPGPVDNQSKGNFGIAHFGLDFQPFLSHITGDENLLERALKRTKIQLIADLGNKEPKGEVYDKYLTTVETPVADSTAQKSCAGSASSSSTCFPCSSGNGFCTKSAIYGRNTNYESTSVSGGIGVAVPLELVQGLLEIEPGLQVGLNGIHIREERVGETPAQADKREEIKGDLRTSINAAVSIYYSLGRGSSNKIFVTAIRGIKGNTTINKYIFGFRTGWGVSRDNGNFQGNPN